MGHPDIKNSSGFEFSPLFVADEEMLPVLATAVKATFSISKQSELSLAEEQRPLLLAGESEGDPDLPSYKYEPEAGFIKISTDVVLVGSAESAQPVQSVDVGLKVGPVQKVIRVIGDRYWVKTGGRIIATKPQPFKKIPLVYERAFGGWDKSNKDEKQWRVDPRNPVGRGFGDPLRYVEEGKVPMPNLEDPNHLIRRYGDAPPPAGFGFISPNWQHRAQFAGTYDAVWDKERKPLLPTDFDRRFFNAASPGLIAPGYLRGDEDVVVVNASPVPQLKFRLPGVPAPSCRVELRSGKIEVLQTNLDTVIINTDEMLLLLLWRAYMPVPNGPHDVVAIEITTERAVRQPAMA